MSNTKSKMQSCCSFLLSTHHSPLYFTISKIISNTVNHCNQDTSQIKLNTVLITIQ